MSDEDPCLQYPPELRTAEEALLRVRSAVWNKEKSSLEAEQIRLKAEKAKIRGRFAANEISDAVAQHAQKEKDDQIAEKLREGSEIDALTNRDGPSSRIGLALSGGGLRSATFSLGFLQALARAKLLRQVDYLSTVSGGSYIGGFLGALYHRKLRTKKYNDVRALEAELANPLSKTVDWLRENGRYLAPGGAADGWAALAVILRNLVAVNVVVWTLLLAVFLGLDLLRALVTGLAGDALSSLLPHGKMFWWSPALVLPAAIVPLALVPIGLAYWLVPNRAVSAEAKAAENLGDKATQWFKWWQTTLVSAVAIPAVALAILLFPTQASALPYAVGWPWDEPEWWRCGSTIAIGVAILVTILAWAYLICAIKTAPNGIQDASQPKHQLWLFQLSRWLRAWLIVFSALLIAAVIDSLGQTAYRAVADSRFREVLVGSIVAAVSVFIGIGAFVQKAVGLIGMKKGKIGAPVGLIALAGALILLVPILVSLSALGHGIVWGWAKPDQVATAVATDNKSPTCELDSKGTVRVQLPPAAAATNGALKEPPVKSWGWALTAFLLISGLCYAIRRNYAFLNDSSIASLYASRLTRAYIGASNPERIDRDDVASTDLLSSDVIPLDQYAPHEAGGPLHIINATLNETIGGRSQVQERDRKGMNLAIGPGGISVGARHHATWQRDRDNRRVQLVSTDDRPGTGFRVFPSLPSLLAGDERSVPANEPIAQKDRATFRPETLTLGRWMAISGAAASTALGSMTSLGLSLLCGILNVRLGHWWWSGVDPTGRKAGTKAPILRRIERRLSRWLPVQTHLFHELMARFPGTAARSWYLTDGGHFENTGAYELLRRRLKAIILVDNGADENRTMADVANLVRKARLDLETDIEFVDPADLWSPNKSGPGAVNSATPFLGTLSDLGFNASGNNAATVRKYAALARIRYGAHDPSVSESTGWLVVVKPGLVDDNSEPIDVREYRRANPSFPQQSTADQFFNEAQWEAYRKLGDHIGTSLFGDRVLARGLGILV